jgi:hypothetical protein
VSSIIRNGCVLIASLLLAACTTQPEQRASACEQAVYNYSAAIDLGNPADAGNSFTEQGTWQLGELKLEGRAAIASHLSKLSLLPNRVSRHIQTNIITNWQEPNRGAGTVYVTLYSTRDSAGPVATMKGQPYFVGHYQDRYEWDGANCLIAERIIVPAFLAR